MMLEKLKLLKTVIYIIYFWLRYKKYLFPNEDGAAVLNGFNIFY